MKANRGLFWLLSAFFLLAAGVYSLWNFMDHGQLEIVGSVGILLSAVLAGFIAFYLSMLSRSQSGVVMPEDADTDVDDADPEMGHFSPWSWWPFVIGLSLFLVFLGLAVGIWVTIIGVPLALVAIVGWTYEYYRGNFGH
jgi:hypothetical protein